MSIFGRSLSFERIAYKLMLKKDTNDTEKMQTNYYMYSEGTMGGIFMDFLQFKILQMI